MTPLTELDEKQERLVTVIKDVGLGGVLLATHHNIAWLTSGRANRIAAFTVEGPNTRHVVDRGRGSDHIHELRQG